MNNIIRVASLKNLFKYSILTWISILCIVSVLFAQTPCSQRVIDNASFTYNGPGVAPARWNFSQADTGGATLDQSAFNYVASGNFSTVNTNFPGGGTNNNTRQYAIVTNPNILSPQYANIPTDGMLVINPLQGQTDQYLTYNINGLVPGNTYNIEIKVWNVMDLAVPGSGCGQWCNWNDQLEMEWDGNGNNAHDGQSNLDWTGTNGTNQGWNGNSNQIGNIMKVSSGGAYAILTAQVTLANATTGFTLTFKKGNSSNPIVLGVDYIKVYGCQQEAINVSGGTPNVCEATQLTLTAQGIGPAGSTYQWYHNGALLTGRTSDTLNIVSGIVPGVNDVYKAVGQWDNISTTLIPKLCCSSVDGTSDEVYRQSFNGLTYTCGPPATAYGPYANLPANTSIDAVDYTYAGIGCNNLNDGQYAVVKNSYAGEFWTNRPEVFDHTGVPGSGALFVNAIGGVGQDFFQSTLSGLCNSTTYEFSIWYASLATGSEIVPYINFNVLQDGTTVATTTTGTIPTNEQWYEATVTFTTPATGTPTYTLEAVNEVTGSGGNDLMLDDIVVKKCTPAINLYENGTTDSVLTICNSNPVDITVNTFYSLPLEITGSVSGTVYYQWMDSIPGGHWTLIGTPVTTGTFTATPTTTTTYYRAKVSASSASAATGTVPVATDCGNDAITNSFSLTKGGNFTIPAITGATNYCTGTTMTLTGDPGTGDQWQWEKGNTYATASPIAGYTFSSNTANKVYSKTFAITDTGTYYFVSETAAGCSAYSTVHVTATPGSVGGTLAPATIQIICSGAAPASNITLSGNTGTVTQWEYSTDKTFATGINTIANTTTTLTAAAIKALSISDTTYFRAKVSNNSCTAAYSDTAIVAVAAASVGGTLAPAAAQTICSGATPSSNITLSGNTGTVVQWEYSTDKTFTSGVKTIANTTTTLIATAIKALSLSDTTYFRAEVSNDNCTAAYSDTSIVIVTAPSVGGTLFPAATQTICGGSLPTSNLALSGNKGNVTEWEYSTDKTFATGVGTIANTTTTLTTAQMGTLNDSTYFRAKVSNGGCTAAYSDTVLIAISNTIAGGKISAAQTICSGTSPNDLTLTGNGGNVLNWESSTDKTFATNTKNILVTSTTLTSAQIGPLSDSTYFFATIKGGTCPSVNSDTILIAVDALSVGGVLSPATTQTICSGSLPSSDITLNDQKGMILGWQSSPDKNFITNLKNISNTTSTLSTSAIGALSDSAYFRALVKNGTCDTAYSTTVLIAVTPPSIGGTLLPDAKQTICEGTAPNAVMVSGYRGTITGWQWATDAQFSSTNSIPELSNTLSGSDFQASTGTKYYRAVVANGICTAAFSDSVIVEIDPASVGGTLSPTTAQTICSGTTPTFDITLSGQTGNIQFWQSSGSSTFTNPTLINNKTTTLTGASIGNLTANTYYHVTVQNGACNAANSDSVLIIVTQPPIQPGVNDTAYCQNAVAVPLTASGENLTWYTDPNGIGSPGAPTPITTVGGTTLYYVTSSDGTCESKKSKITVTIDSISAYAGGPIVDINQGQSYLIQGSASPANATITWSPDYAIDNTSIATPTVTPLVDTTYTMIVVSNTNPNCTDTSYISIVVVKQLIIPNAFSPNGDGINDVWKITNMEEYSAAQVEIFDRYGQMIFESTGGYASSPWDGKYNGKLVPVGTYFYIINPGNGKPVLSGSVSVIR